LATWGTPGAYNQIIQAIAVDIACTGDWDGLDDLMLLLMQTPLQGGLLFMVRHGVIGVASQSPVQAMSTVMVWMIWFAICA
jgi:hypothetical protein